MEVESLFAGQHLQEEVIEFGKKDVHLKLEAAHQHRRRLPILQYQLLHHHKLSLLALLSIVQASYRQSELLQLVKELNIMRGSGY